MCLFIFCRIQNFNTLASSSTRFHTDTHERLLYQIILPKRSVKDVFQSPLSDRLGNRRVCRPWDTVEWSPSNDVANLIPERQLPEQQ